MTNGRKQPDRLYSGYKSSFTVFSNPVHSGKFAKKTNNMFLVHLSYDQFSSCQSQLIKSDNHQEWVAEESRCVIRSVCVFNILDGCVHHASAESIFLLPGYWGSTETIVLCNELNKAGRVWHKLIGQDFSQHPLHSQNQTSPRKPKTYKNSISSPVQKEGDLIWKTHRCRGEKTLSNHVLFVGQTWKVTQKSIYCSFENISNK